MARAEQAHKDLIEQLLDEAGFQTFLQCLGEVCYEKESHLLEAWQDKEQAKVWKNRGSLVQKMASSELKKNGPQPF